jgi:hypothetical protein
VASLQPQHTRSNHLDLTTRAICQRSSRITGEQQGEGNFADSFRKYLTFPFPSAFRQNLLKYPDNACADARMEVMTSRKAKAGRGGGGEGKCAVARAELRQSFEFVFLYCARLLIRWCLRIVTF